MTEMGIPTLVLLMSYHLTILIQPLLVRLIRMLALMALVIMHYLTIQVWQLQVITAHLLLQLLKALLKEQ